MIEVKGTNLYIDDEEYCFKDKKNANKMALTLNSLYSEIFFAEKFVEFFGDLIERALTNRLKDDETFKAVQEIVSLLEDAQRQLEESQKNSEE